MNTIQAKEGTSNRAYCCDLITAIPASLSGFCVFLLIRLDVVLNLSINPPRPKLDQAQCHDHAVNLFWF